MGRLLGLAGAQTPELLDTKHKIEDVEPQTEVVQKDADTVECPESRVSRSETVGVERSATGVTCWCLRENGRAPVSIVPVRFYKP